MVRLQDVDESVAVSRGESHGREPCSRSYIRRRDAKAIAKAGGIHRSDVAARRGRRDAARCGLQFSFGGESREKYVMIGRVLGDQHHAGHRARRVWVFLKCRVPEVFGIMLLACREAYVRSFRVTRKGI